MGAGAKKQKPTSQELAMGIRQEEELSTETAKSERKFKALTRNRLGAKSLLSGAPGGGDKTPANPTVWNNVNAPPAAQPRTRTGR